jgi:hypothetical protein
MGILQIVSDSVLCYFFLWVYETQDKADQTNEKNSKCMKSENDRGRLRYWR